MVALLLSGQHHFADAGLAHTLPRRGKLNAVIDSIAHQVNQGIGECLDQVFIQIGPSPTSSR